MAKKILAAAAATGLLSACATTSFSVKTPSDAPTESSTMAQASARANTFYQAYDKTYAHLANGRQYFEVPALLAGLGGVIGTAFGGGPDVAKAAASVIGTSTVFGKYYAPQQKANYFLAAKDAMLCVQGVADGFSTVYADGGSGDDPALAITSGTPPRASEVQQTLTGTQRLAKSAGPQNQQLRAMQNSPSLAMATSVVVDSLKAQKVKARMVDNAVNRIHTILATRIASAGSFSGARDAIAGLSVNIEEAIKKHMQVQELYEKAAEKAQEQVEQAQQNLDTAAQAVAHAQQAKDRAAQGQGNGSQSAAATADRQLQAATAAHTQAAQEANEAHATHDAIKVLNSKGISAYKMAVNLETDLATCIAQAGG